MINISYQAEEKIIIKIQKSSRLNDYILTFCNPTDGFSNTLMVVLSSENLDTLKNIIEEVN